MAGSSIFSSFSLTYLPSLQIRQYWIMQGFPSLCVKKDANFWTEKRPRKDDTVISGLSMLNRRGCQNSKDVLPGFLAPGVIQSSTKLGAAVKGLWNSNYGP